MNRHASKLDAVKLITTAKREGWKVEVDRLNCGGKTSLFCQMVCMTKRLTFPNGYTNLSSQVIVSFRKGRKGWNVAIAVPNGKRTFRGLWNAHYALNTMRETEARQLQRLEVA